MTRVVVGVAGRYSYLKVGVLRVNTLSLEHVRIISQRRQIFSPSTSYSAGSPTIKISFHSVYSFSPQQVIASSFSKLRLSVS